MIPARVLPVLVRALFSACFSMSRGAERKAAHEESDCVRGSIGVSSRLFLFLFGFRAFTIKFALFSAACSCGLVMCVSAVPNIHCHGVVDMLPDTHLWIAFLGGCGCDRLGRLLAGGLALHCLACAYASTLAAQPVVEYAFLSQPAPTQL